MLMGPPSLPAALLHPAAAAAAAAASCACSALQACRRSARLQSASSMMSDTWRCPG